VVTEQKRPSSRIESKAWTREQVLHSARQVFAERGYEGASITEIAKAANVAVGSVYGHFSTKQDLYWAVLNQRLEAERESAGAAVGTTTVESFVEKYNQLLLDTAEQTNEVALQTEVWQHAIRDEGFRREMARRQRHVQEMVTQLVSKLRAGAGQPDEHWQLTDQELAAAATALFRGLVQARCLDRGSIPDALFGKCILALLTQPAPAETDMSAL
jgi:AcrR family transcriptional regulator